MFVNLLGKQLNENGFWNDFNRLHNELSRGLYLNDFYKKDKPALNYYVNEDGAFVDCLVPGFAEEQIDISINDKELTISGKKEKETIDENSTVVLSEIREENFSRTIELPFRVDTDKVAAEYKNGILRIALPKAESEKPKKIKIN